MHMEINSKQEIKMCWFCWSINCIFTVVSLSKIARKKLTWIHFGLFLRHSPVSFFHFLFLICFNYYYYYYLLFSWIEFRLKCQIQDDSKDYFGVISSVLTSCCIWHLIDQFWNQIRLLGTTMHVLSRILTPGSSAGSSDISAAKNL